MWHVNNILHIHAPINLGNKALCHITNDPVTRRENQITNKGLSCCITIVGAMDERGRLLAQPDWRLVPRPYDCERKNPSIHY